jgi:hypothetical protein
MKFKNTMTREQNTGFGATAALVLLVIEALTGVDLHGAIMATLIATVLCPWLFTPASAVWYMAGRHVEQLFSTVTLALIYFLVVTPVGLMRRRFAKDTLSLRKFRQGDGSVFDVKEKTYCADDLKHPY